MEMTPLIDVVFLLLTFFVMALVLMVRAELLDVRLPVLSAAAPARAGEFVTVALDAEGGLFVDGERAGLPDVAGLIRARRETKPRARVLIAVDEGGRNDVLLGLLNELARAEVRDFAIVGRRPPAEAVPPAGPPRPPTP